MGLFSKKNKNQPKQDIKNNNTKEFSSANKNPSQGNVVSQQDTPFDVEPNFFNYEKVKLNHFLTDDKEYNKKKLIDDCPRGNANYLNISQDYVDIMKRFNKDEAAFAEIYNNMNINKIHTENGIKTTRDNAIYNLVHLDDDNIRRPVRTRPIDKEFYKRVGEKLDQDSKYISEKTSAFLKEMHTKILDLNHINEFSINRNIRYESGGFQTTKPYSTIEGGVNRYKNLTKALNHTIPDKKSDEFYAKELTQKDIDDLNTIKNSKQSQTKNWKDDYFQEKLERHNRNIENGYVPPRNPNRTSEFANRGPQFQDDPNSNQSSFGSKNLDFNNQFINKENQLNLFNDEKVVKKPKITIENGKTYNELLVESIQDKIVEHSKNRDEMNSQMKGVIRQNETIDYTKLIPLNEIKMDLRIRKSEKRDFKFIPREN